MVLGWLRARIKLLAGLLVSYTVYTVIALFIPKLSFIAAPLAGFSGTKQDSGIEAFVAPAIAVLAAVASLTMLYSMAAPTESTILLSRLGPLAYMPYILQPLQAGLVGLGAYLIATSGRRVEGEAETTSPELA